MTDRQHWVAKPATVLSFASTLAPLGCEGVLLSARGPDGPVDVWCTRAALGLLHDAIPRSGSDTTCSRADLVEVLLPAYGDQVDVAISAMHDYGIIDLVRWRPDVADGRRYRGSIVLQRLMDESTPGRDR